MSQLQIQIVFVAIVVLFAFDEGQDGPGPVRIKSSSILNLIIIYVNLIINYRTCRSELGGHKSCDSLLPQLLSQHGCQGIVSKQKRHNVTVCGSNVCIGKCAIKML